ncbi:MAG TPA: uroporphyrinogen decarboxylase family protein [Candidatus Brocadiia bacterium]|nr:uroporphyrinogen decarboxylase family protein [Candidatus Brocadiia bacterium]
MTQREEFLKYVREGGERPAVSLQIGAGAGFDSKLAGKDWIGQTTLEDTIRAYETVGGMPFYNIGLPGFDSVVPEIAWKHESGMKESARVTISRLETPYGVLTREFHEQRLMGCSPTRYPLSFGDSLDVVKWYGEQFVKGAPYVADLLSPTIQKLRLHGPVSVQWNLQPFEIFGLANAVEQVMMLTDDTKTYRMVCDDVLHVNLVMLKAAIRAGADFVFVGGPGREVASPLVYEEFLIPDSRRVSDAVHACGGLVYSHICSPIEPFLTFGYYNRMGLDLFETLSPPPVGNVPDLALARRMLPREMCTRGNIGLDLLLNGTVEEVERETLRIIEATRGFKHFVAASDYLFHDIPLENARAVVRTVERCGG